MPPELGVHGVSKRAVSERFVVGTAKKLAALMQRKLGGLKLLAAVIDGVHFAITWCWPRSALGWAARSSSSARAKNPLKTPPRATRCSRT
jgi:hypothetical protein